MCGLLAESLPAGHIRVPHGPGFGKLSTGIDLAGKQVCGCFTACLTRQSHIKYRFYFVDPRGLHRTAAKEHHHRVGICGSHCLDEADMPLRHGHALPIKALGFISIRQTRANHCHPSCASRGCRLSQAFLRHSTLRVASGSEGHTGQCIAQSSQFGGIDVAGPRPLVPHGAGHLTDEGNITFRHRQNISLIFQQDRAVFRDGAGQGVVGLFVKRFSFGAALSFQCQGNDPGCACIHGTLRQSALQYRLFDPVLHVIAATGHGQVTPGPHGRYPVAQGTPIGDHQPFKAPFGTQYVSEQPCIVAGMHTVDARIAAHDCLRLSRLDDCLKRRQIKLPQGTFVHLTVAVEALVLLIVSGKMLQACPHPGTLRPLHPGLTHGSCHEGILGKVFKVTPA